LRTNAEASNAREQPLSTRAGQFATTHWSVVLAAGCSRDPNAHEALAKLCGLYWYPLYVSVRRRGYSPEDAQDLTQAFFARLLEKNYVGQADRQRGKFRTFLLAALDHFLADEWDRIHRLKRYPGQPLFSLDALEAEERYRLEPIDRWDASKLYERRWATTLLEHALARLEAEFSDTGRGAAFAQLKQFLIGPGTEVSYGEAAARAGTTAAALKMSVSRLRRRCRELLREEIAATVGTPEEAEEEYRALLAAFQQ